ncbi:MAG: LiaF domain-containing protein, partial [Actinocatenispora sp.]
PSAGPAPAGATSGPAYGAEQSRVSAPGAWSVPPTGVQEPSYRAPFAPHGPYRPHTATSNNSDEVPLAGWSYGSDATPPPPPPPGPGRRPRRERSILGRLTFFALCLAIGAVAVLSVLTGTFTISAFFAVGLGVVGVGLVVGAWRGRARWLILLGCVLAVGLPVSWAGEHVTARPDWPTAARDTSDHRWTPATVQSVRPWYHTDLGNGTLDLSRVDFADQPRSVSVRSNFGNVRVILPPDVDTTVRTSDGVGSIDLFGVKDDGPHDATTPRSDVGADGPGGGTLTLNVEAPVGNVQVTR